MPRKNVVSAFKMIEDGDMSTEIISNETDVKNLDTATVRVAWDIGGTPVGVLTIEALQEKDDTAAASDASNWFTVDIDATITIDNTETDHQILFKNLPFDKIRLKYTATSGTGTMNAKITAKQAGS